MSSNDGEEIFSIGQRLREERDRIGLSQVVFGLRLETTDRTVKKWEGNETSPRATDLLAAARLGVDVLYVVTGHRSPLAAQEGRASITPAEHLARRLGGMVLDEATAKALLVIVEQFVALDPLLRARAQGYLDALADQSAVIEGTEGMISLYDFSTDQNQGGSEKQGT